MEMLREKESRKIGAGRWRLLSAPTLALARALRGRIDVHMYQPHCRRRLQDKIRENATTPCVTSFELNFFR